MARHNFRAVPCREVNGIQSYSIYKNNLPFIRPADGQIIDRGFASKLVELCTIHFADHAHEAYQTVSPVKLGEDLFESLTQEEVDTIIDDVMS